MNAVALARGLTLVATLAPMVPFVLIGAALLLRRTPNEHITAHLVRLSLLTTALSSTALGVVMVWAGLPRVLIPLGLWIDVASYRLGLELLVDSLSLPMLVLTAVLCGIVGAFSRRYMHREPGFHRFFLLFSLFTTGMCVLVLAGSVTVLLVAWEMVGVASALLVGFFRDRPAPARNTLRVFVVYRVCDLGLLLAVVGLHHAAGTDEFELLFGPQPWPGGSFALSGTRVTVVALFILLAAMGKSAQVPFSGWLPRAMEGPTPSSAIFYGALSVHAGAFLLLRLAPLLERAPVVTALVVAVGALTVLAASSTTRVQTDIKSALAYASLTQVGVIFIEVGLGLRRLALVHIIGHACVRTLQFLRAPSLLHDLHEMEASVGGHLPREQLGWLSRRLPARTRRWLYRHALERTYLDGALDRFVVAPLVASFRALDAADRRWVAWLAGRPAPAARPRDRAVDADGPAAR